LSDADGDTISAALNSITLIDGLSSSNLLIFDPMLIDASMEIGDWQAKLDLVGESRDGYVCVDTLSLDWVTVQEGPILQDVSSTVDPRGVTQDQDSVEVSVAVSNSGGADVTLDLTSSISFTDGSVNYQSFLTAPTTIPAEGGESVLRFSPQRVPAEMSPQSYPLTFDLHGTDSNEKPYDASFVSDITNSIEVQTPPDLAYIPGSLDPMEVTRGQEVSFRVDLLNSGQAGVVLPGNETVLRFQDIAGHEVLAYLADTVQIGGETGKADVFGRNESGMDLILSSSKETGRLNFTLAQIDSSFVGGAYVPELEISGTDYNGKGYELTVLAETLTVLAPPALRVSFSAPATVSLNQTFQVAMDAANSGGVGALGVSPSPARLNVSGSGDVTYRSGPEPASFNLPAGSTGTFIWEYQAGSSTGWVSFSGEAVGLDEVSGDSVRSGTETSPSLVLQVPASLSASFSELPLDYYVGYEFQVTLQVQNTGEALADSIYPEPLSPSNPGFVLLQQGPVPTQLQLSGGEVGQFLWRYRLISGEGQWLYLSGRVYGTDVNSGTVVTSGLVTSDSMYIHSATATELRVLPQDRAPTSCAAGQRDMPMLDLDLRNVGDTMVHTASITRFLVSLEDEGENPIVPAHAVSALSIYDYAGDSILATSSAPDTGSRVAIDIPDTLYVRAGESVTVGILADVAGSPRVTGFRVNLADTASITAFDSVWAAADSLLALRIRDRSGEPVLNMRSDYSVVLGSDLEGSFCNYPNPFAPGEEVTHITYNLTSNSDVAIRIYTLIGELVWTREFSTGSPEAQAGFHEVDWDGHNEDGQMVRNGVYLCQIEANGETAMTKIAVAK
jgi:hypothetical protein